MTRHLWDLGATLSVAWSVGYVAGLILGVRW